MSLIGGDVTGSDTINPYTEKKQWEIEAKIVDGSIETSMFAAGAIDSDAIGTGSITTSKIADNAITNVTIANDAITNNKIADDSKRRFRILNSAGTVLFELDGIVPE